MQQHSRVDCVIVVQTVKGCVLECAKDFRNRIRQTIRSAEDRISVRICRLRLLPEKAQFAFIADQVVDFERGDLCDSRSRIDLNIVVRQIIGVRTIGQRKQCLNFQCDRIETLFRNYVVREGISVQLSVRCWARRRWIVDHAFQHLPSLWIDADHLRYFRYSRAEVTIPIRQSRNRLKLVIHVLGLAELLPVDEKERPVFPYRAAYRETIIISPGTRPRVWLAGLKWIAGVEHLVDEIVIHRSVKLVRSGFHRDVENTATYLTIFRSIVAGLNRNLLNGINIRLRLCRNTRSSRI